MSELADEAAPITPTSSEVVMHGRVWDIRRDRIVLGGDETVREYMAHPGSVVVLAEDDDGRVVVVRQYRHPVGERLIELPAGLLDVPGEDPVAAGQRELAEEVDLVAEHWEHLLDLHASPGGSSEVIHVYLARGISEAPHAFQRTHEEAEFVPEWHRLEDLVDAVLERRITNGPLVAAVLARQLQRDRARSEERA